MSWYQDDVCVAGACQSPAPPGTEVWWPPRDVSSDENLFSGWWCQWRALWWHVGATSMSGGPFGVTHALQVITARRRVWDLGTCITSPDATWRLAVCRYLKCVASFGSCSSGQECHVTDAQSVNVTQLSRLHKSDLLAPVCLVSHVTWSFDPSGVWPVPVGCDTCQHDPVGCDLCHSGPVGRDLCHCDPESSVPLGPSRTWRLGILPCLSQRQSGYGTSIRFSGRHHGSITTSGT